MQITPGPSAPTTLDGSPDDYTITTGNGVTYLRRHGGPLKRVSANEPVCFRELSFRIEGGQFVPLWSVGGAVSSVEPVKRVTIEYASGRKDVVGK